MKIFLTIMLAAFFCPLLIAKDNKKIVVFHPHSEIRAEVSINKSRIEYAIFPKNSPQKKEIPLGIESQPSIEIEDFNFDGYQDFSVRYLDEGMGKYTIHRIFIFENNLNNFTEANPKCGEEFLNLKVDRISQKLVSSYFADNQVLSCTTRLKKSK